MAHANAALTPRHRLKLGRAVVEDGWTVSYAAAVFNVSWPTANKWAQRYRTGGPAAMEDRSSRPHSCPRRTPRPMVRRIVHLRWRKRLGPVAIADRLGLAPATVHAVLVRCRINRLSHVDRRTGEPDRRYGQDTPSALLNVDVKKLGNIPDGRGWRYTGRQQGYKDREPPPRVPRCCGPRPNPPPAPRRPPPGRPPPPLRARHPQCAAARRCEEAGQHPRRRRLALHRPPARLQEPRGHPRQAPQQAPRTV